MGKVARCVVIGASPETPPALIAAQVLPSDFVICADGGVQLAQQAGVRVDLSMGDFDSGSPLPGTETIACAPEKDYTDMDMAIQEGLRRGFTVFLILGGTGGRLSHTLANLRLLLRTARQGVQVEMLDKTTRIVPLVGPEGAVSVPDGALYSVFTLGEDAVISEAGAKYPLDYYRLSAEDSLGVSNLALAHTRVVVHSGAVLLVFEQESN